MATGATVEPEPPLIFSVRNIQEQMRFDDDFCNFLTRTGLPCLNVTVDLIRAAQESKERLYYWLDIHWTPKGNRVAAETVARYLRQHPELAKGHCASRERTRICSRACARGLALPS